MAYHFSLSFTNAFGHLSETDTRVSMKPSGDNRYVKFFR